MSGTITSANSVFTMAILRLFPVPQRLEGYSTDGAFSTEAIEVAETMIGVDGKMSAGFVFNLTKQSITLQADSPSNDLFEAWHQAQKAAKEIYYANGAITLPSIGKSYIMVNGVLSSYIAIPDARKVLQPRAFAITWESVNPTPIL